MPKLTAPEHVSAIEAAGVTFTVADGTIEVDADFPIAALGAIRSAGFVDVVADVAADLAASPVPPSEPASEQPASEPAAPETPAESAPDTETPPAGEEQASA